MNIVTITTKEAFEKINQSNGSWFSCSFVKRTTGEERTMTCRTGVKKYVTGVGLKYNREEHKLVGVWVVGEGKEGADAYRNIPMEGIFKLKISGVEYNVVDEERVSVVA